MADNELEDAESIRVCEGVPPPQYKQPLCDHTQPLCGLIHLKLILEKNSQNPMFTSAHPPKHKQPLCGHTQPLCGLIDVKTLLEHTFQSPMFTRGSPSTTQTITVWAHTTTVLVNSPQITTGKQLSEPHVYQGPSPTTQTTTVWAHTTTVWVN